MRYVTLDRDGKKGEYILLSNSCLVLPAVVKQQLEDISRNHVPSLFAVSVLPTQQCVCQCSLSSFVPANTLHAGSICLLLEICGCEAEKAILLQRPKPTRYIMDLGVKFV